MSWLARLKNHNVPAAPTDKTDTTPINEVSSVLSVPPASVSENLRGRLADSQGVAAEIRTWAQSDDGGWHGIAVGRGWWQWCGKFRTLHEALQAAERAKD